MKKSISEISGGEPVWLKLPGVELTDSKEGKPVGMQTHISRRPNFISGDSDDNPSIANRDLHQRS